MEESSSDVARQLLPVEFTWWQWKTWGNCYLDKLLAVYFIKVVNSIFGSIVLENMGSGCRVILTIVHSWQSTSGRLATGILRVDQKLMSHVGFPTRLLLKPKHRILGNFSKPKISFRVSWKPVFLVLYFLPRTFCNYWLFIKKCFWDNAQVHNTLAAAHFRVGVIPDKFSKTEKVLFLVIHSLR